MEVKLTKTHGCIALTGSVIDRMAQSNSGQDKQYHVTLFTKDELRGSNENKNTNIELPIDLGLGKVRNELFKVLYWPQGNIFRKQYGLPEKQFHITIGGTNDHTIDKGVKSIVEPSALSEDQIETIIQQCISSCKSHESRSSALDIVRFLIASHTGSMTDKAFDGSWRILSKLGHPDESHELAFSYVSLHPDSIAAQLRCGDSRDATKEAKKAIFHYAQAAHLALQTPNCPTNILPLCTKGIVKCSEHTEFGPYFRDDELAMWRANSLFDTYGEAFKNAAVWKLIQDEFAKSMSSLDIDILISQTSSVDSDVAVFTPIDGSLIKLPRFFRWLIPFRLAVMSQPKTKQHIETLVSCGITLIITLTDERSLPSEWFEDTPCRNIYIPVRDHKAPSHEQVDTFIKAMDELPPDEAALIHCAGGKGRAGTFAACYLMARGFHSSSSSSTEPPYMFPTDSIRFLRHTRPSSIETIEQEIFIKQYSKHLTSVEKASTQGPTTTIPEPQSPLEIAGVLPHLPSLIICCGIPGSGKSTFSSLLSTHLSYETISQDELGSRASCLSSLSNSLLQNQRILIDRCNPYPEDRLLWLSHSFFPADAICIYFDINPSLCIARADSRVNHPTIPQGRARKVVNSFLKTFVPPTLKEKFCCVVRVPSTFASKRLLLKLGVSEHFITEAYSNPNLTPFSCQESHTKQATKPFIHKFPRTRHLFNLGSATRDDLLLSTSDATSFLTPSSTTTLTVEEKVDGANLGISVSPSPSTTSSTTPFLLQNRSHYIHPSSHPQFKPLTTYLSTHHTSLLQILLGKDSNEYKPGDWILYGEWLYARHSITYTSLPCYFLAFDLYHTVSKTFLSHEEVGKRLEGTWVTQVKKIAMMEGDAESGTGLPLDQNTLLKLVKEQKSAYGDGVVEGVYVRREQGGKTIDRAKMVRPDFIAGNEHWSRGVITPNLVIFPLDRD